MAGHSKFKNIMHRKGAQDAKRAKLFNKLAREITVAAKVSPDPGMNPRLRLAITTARSQSMPKDRIEKAIQVAQGGNEGDNYTEMRYEGFGPYGIAIIVEALTDNKNRTASELRTIFSKAGGGLGETGSVAFGFSHIGRIVYPITAKDEDKMTEIVLEVGADDLTISSEGYVIATSVNEFGRVRDALENTLGGPEEAGLSWEPLTPVALNVEQAQSILKLIDTLEDNDDVQQVYSNVDISDDVALALE